MEFDSIVTHGLTKSDFGSDVILSRWWPWCQFALKSAAIWRVNTLCLVPVQQLWRFLIC